MVTNKSTKNEGPSEKEFHEKTGWRFQTKKNVKYFFSLDLTNPWHRQPLNATIEDGPCNQEEKNRRKIEKSIQIKSVRAEQEKN